MTLTGLIQSLLGGSRSKIFGGIISSSTKLNFFRLCRVSVARAVREEWMGGSSSTGEGSAAVILRFNL